MDIYDDSVIQRFWRYVQKTDTCWLWTGAYHDYGYGLLNVRRNNRSRNLFAHRLSYVLHKGPIPTDLWVLHDCPDGDNPACVNPDHLWVGTHLDNMQDMRQKRRTAHGDRNGSRTHPERVPRGSQRPMAKLTEEQVPEIRRRFHAVQGKRGILAQLGREFNVSPSAIALVVQRKTWTHVH